MKMTLPEFISEHGDAEFAALVEEPIRTVQSWRRRERMPRPGKARKIIRIANGRLDLASIYGCAEAAEDEEVTPVKRAG